MIAEMLYYYFDVIEKRMEYAYDVFASLGVVDNMPRIVIETHSEYLIRKLQYLVASRKVKPNYLKIYYFSGNPKSKQFITEMVIDKYGYLEPEFGSGFFDESSKIITELWKERSTKN